MSGKDYWRLFGDESKDKFVGKKNAVMGKVNNSLGIKDDRNWYYKLKDKLPTLSLRVVRPSSPVICMDASSHSFPYNYG